MKLLLPGTTVGSPASAKGLVNVSVVTLFACAMDAEDKVVLAMGVTPERFVGGIGVTNGGPSGAS